MRKKQLSIIVDSLKLSREEDKKAQEELKDSFEKLKSFKETKFSLIKFTFDFENKEKLNTLILLDRENKELANKLHILEKRLYDKEEVCKDLRSSIETKNSELFAYKSSIIDKDGQIEKLHKNLILTESKVREIESLKAVKDNQIIHQEKEIEALNMKINEINREKHQLKDEISLALTQNTEMISNTNKGLYEKVDELIDENRKLKTLFSSLEKGVVVEDHLNNLTEMKKKLSEMNKQLILKDNNLFQQKCKIGDLELLLQSSNNKIDLLEAKVKKTIETRVSGYLLSNSAFIENTVEETYDTHTNVGNSFSENIYYKYLSNLKKLDYVSLQLKQSEHKVEELNKLITEEIQTDPSAKYNFLLSRIKDLRTQNEKLEKEIRDIKEKNKTIYEKNNQFEEDKKGYDNKIMEDEKVRDQLQSEIQELKKQIENYKSDLQKNYSLHEEIKDLNQTIHILENNLNKQEAELSEKKTILNETLIQLENEKKKVVDKEEYASRLSNQLMELQAKIVEDEKRNMILLTTKDKELSRLKDDYEVKLKEVEKVRENSSNEQSLLHQISSLEKEKKDAVTEKNKSFNRDFLLLKRARTSVEALRKITKDLEEKVKDLESEKSNKESSIFEERIKGLEANVSSLKKKIRENDESYQKNLKKLKTENDFFKDREKNFKAEVEVLSKNVSAAGVDESSQQKDLKTKFVKMINKLQLATHMFNVKDRIISNLEDENENLKKAVEEKEIVLLDNGETLLRLSEENKALVQAKEEIRNRMDVDSQVMKKQIDKYRIEKDIVVDEIKSLVNVCSSCALFSQLSDQKSEAGSIHTGHSAHTGPTGSSDKKTLTMLLPLLRKSSKVIKVLEEKMSVLSEQLKEVKHD